MGVLTKEEMLANCKKTANIKTGDRITAVYYGPAGSGKTSMAGTNESPIWFANFDPAGMDTLRGMENVYFNNFYDMDAAHPKGMQGFFDFVNTGMHNDFFTQFKTVVLDPLTGFEEAAMNWVLHKEKKVGETPSLPNYATVTRLTWRAVKMMLAIECCNVVITCHEKPEKCELTGRVRIYPLIYGRSSNEIFRLFSEAYHLDGSGSGKTRYRAQIKSDKLYTSKSRLDKKGSILDAFENPNQMEIVKKVKDKEPKKLV